FDFTCNRDVTREKLTEIETLVQEKIFEDAAVETKEVPLEEAIKDGAVALFIDRYGEKVRMVRTGGFHAEVCGGTHVERTGQIGVFKITASSSIGKNLKRIEAVTGPEAIAYLNRGQEILEKTGELLGVDKEKVLERVARLKEELTEKERRLEQAEAVIVEQLAAKLKEDAEKVKFSGGEVRLVVARVKVWSRESLGRMADRIESQLAPAVVILGADLNQKLFLLIKISESLKMALAAGKLMKELSPLIKGSGGGSATFAQGSGRIEADFDLIRERAYRLIQEQ
ncbi:MAG TPA: DHHA1 domain-containing protein, partial [bacterium]|nr:DHHA1 domain-containing protein [bacterium]